MTRQIVLARYPEDRPAPADFALEEALLGALNDGELLVAVTHLSMDPFPRLRMAERPIAGPAIRIGDPIDSRGIGEVLESRHPAFRAGDLVSGDTGWRDMAVLLGDKVRRIDRELGPAERHLSLLGPSGLTAYFTIERVGQPQAGETALIAPAAGSVGSLAGQIAALRGARVVGVGRGAEQCGALVDKLGFSASVDSANEPLDLGEVGPVHMFLDGVGGRLHDAVLPQLGPRARVILLGFISGYGSGAPPSYGNAAPILFKRARMEGFLLADWEAEFEAATRQLAAWADEGRIRPVESIWEGLESAPSAFAALFGDAPPGKQIVRVERRTS
jgi:NADPH-dependent curcumin reductase CurA